ncbi:hypothetical protein BS78_09G038300 [Paspalum vaginatum]|nr:hypothetical protein BS78_09G038300 [Paspalum vaginatum]
MKASRMRHMAAGQPAERPQLPDRQTLTPTSNRRAERGGAVGGGRSYGSAPCRTGLEDAPTIPVALGRTAMKDEAEPGSQQKSANVPRHLCEVGPRRRLRTTGQQPGAEAELLRAQPPSCAGTGREDGATGANRGRGRGRWSGGQEMRATFTPKRHSQAHGGMRRRGGGQAERASGGGEGAPREAVPGQRAAPHAPAAAHRRIGRPRAGSGRSCLESPEAPAL